MPQSTFAANGTQIIDGIDQAFAPGGVWNLGAVYLGGSKAAVRRCLGRFDVFGAAAAGRPLLPADAVTDAELLLETTSVAGPAPWPARVERIARADWDYTTANWNRYKTGSNWTTGGGDVATPPPAVAFSSPAAGGAFVIAGLADYVTDAITSRGGHVLIRLRADDEAPAQSQWCAFDASLASSLRPRLRVSYTESAPSPIDRPQAIAVAMERAARPHAPDRPAQPERTAGERAPSPVGTPYQTPATSN